MLPWVSSVIDHRGCKKCGKNIRDTLACGLSATSLFLPHYDVICDLLLNRHTATWNLSFREVHKFYYKINSAFATIKRDLHKQNIAHFRIIIIVMNLFKNETFHTVILRKMSYICSWIKTHFRMKG